MMPDEATPAPPSTPTSEVSAEEKTSTTETQAEKHDEEKTSE